MDPVGAAVRACPFLRSAAASQGEGYARNLALNPFASAAAGPLLLEEGLSSFTATLKLFHGPGGVVPLKRFSDDASGASGAPASGCPFRAAAAAQLASSQAAPESTVSAHATAVQQRCSREAAEQSGAGRSVAAGGGATCPFARIPFASLSISGFGFVPDPGQAFSRPPRQKKQPKQQRKPADPSSSRGGPGTSGNTAGGGGAGRPGAVSSSPGISTGGSAIGGAGSSGRVPHGGASLRPGAGGPPANGWGRVLGGLIPLTAGGHLQCPAPIVKMRAAIAALKPVRQLRPQALPIRALAMGGTAVAAGLPCGAWREHTRKFSPQWFLAVHATIPFVAMLRKAVLMPKWAILLTLAGSIAGQSVGARMERERLRQLSARPQLAELGNSSAPLAPVQPSRQLQDQCVMPSLDEGCRRALQAAQAAAAWVMAPTVVA